MVRNTTNLKHEKHNNDKKTQQWSETLQILFPQIKAKQNTTMVKQHNNGQKTQQWSEKLQI